MDSLSSIISAVVAGLGLLAASPIGPVEAPHIDFAALDRPVAGHLADIRTAEGVGIGRIMSQGPTASDPKLLPEIFVRAVIAVEDRRFGAHPGIDARALAAAALSTARGRKRGGSGIAQQTVKNVWLGPERSWERKLLEGAAALRLTANLDEEALLGAYLSHAWFGRGVTGAAGAAEAWFGRDWDDLSVGEMAFLAGLLRGPGWYDPERHPERARDRRNTVLSLMHAQGVIDEATARAQADAPLDVVPARDRSPEPGSAWMMSSARGDILREIAALDGRDRLISRLDVTVNIDPQWQVIAQEEIARKAMEIGGVAPLGSLPRETLEALAREAGDGGAAGTGLARTVARDHLAGRIPWSRGHRPVAVVAAADEGWTLLLDSGRIDVRSVTIQEGLDAAPGQILILSEAEAGPELRGRPGVEGAAVLIDPATGALLASIGGAAPEASAFDRTRALRQPGSAVKAFLWLAALEAGYHPATPVPDIEQTWETAPGVFWRPRNYGGRQSGMISLSSAFAMSSNLVAAALIDAVGIAGMAAIAEAAGVYPEGMRAHPTAALGAMETTLRDLVAGHAAIVNAGVPRQVTAIRDLEIDGRPVIGGGLRLGEGRFGQGPIAGRAAIEDMVSMLHEVVTRGTASAALGDHPVTLVGKTGTSQGYRDAWFIGLTPDLAIGVWFGRDDSEGLPGRASGGRVAAPVAARILARGHAKGLIDSEGLRPAGHVPAITWPPAAPVRGAGARAPSAGAVFDTETGSDRFDIPNRNADLLERRRR